MEFDLHAAARRVMAGAGFPVNFPANISSDNITIHDGKGHIDDLRGLLWSSIDNSQSKDLDQIEVTETHSTGMIKLMVGIADVDAFVPKGSVLDEAAKLRATSVYTGIENFPMLPTFLSEDKTSLLPNVDRYTMITELLVDQSGSVQECKVYRALTQNRAKLTYEEIGAWLDNNGTVPESVTAVPGLTSQIKIQDTVSTHLRDLRRSVGALDFDTVEMAPIIENGRVVEFKVIQRGRSRYMIENFMVAANTAVSSYLRSNNFPAIQRVVKKPARWDRIVQIARDLHTKLPDEPNSIALSHFLEHRKKVDPFNYPDLSLSIIKLLGPGEYIVIDAGGDAGEHFGLAVQGYTHSTAPNRRYIDLVIQRLLKAACAGENCPYTLDELIGIAEHCNKQTSAAKKISRIMRKAAVALLLKDRIGEIYSAIVTGAKPTGVYARISDPPIEGRIIIGEKHLDVGDKIEVKLISVDPEKGYIDFEKV